jgi:hypothetical protein
VAMQVVAHDVVWPRHARARRWPVLVAVSTLAAAVALTGLLAVRDRMNSDAASPSAANQARDAVAVLSLQHVASSLALAQGLQDHGVLGFGEIRVGGFRRDVVAPLGGTLITSRRAWTLALGGGWACLRFVGADNAATPVVTRGVCKDVPIESTPTVSIESLRVALAKEAAVQRAAVAAVQVSDRIASKMRDNPHRFSLSVLATTLGQMSENGVRADLTIEGVTVQVRGSVACLVPSRTEATVLVALGRCAS